MILNWDTSMKVVIPLMDQTITKGAVRLLKVVLVEANRQLTQLNLVLRDRNHSIRPV